MDPSSISNPFFQPSFSLLVFFACCVFLIPRMEAAAASDYSNLVYNNCANHTLTDHPIDHSHSHALSSLLEILAVKSLHSSFFKGGVADNRTAVFGLFQCRGDLSSADCHSCVSRLPALSKNLCGDHSLGGRVQLSGCYIQYEVADEVDYRNSESELLYKLCGEETEEEMGNAFDETRDEAFAAVEEGVTSGRSQSNGWFYRESINGETDLMAQCQRDMGTCECGECVSNAVQVAQQQCKSSVSGQIYMDKCYLGYNFHSNGIPSDHEDKKGTSSAAKTVAILVGASAALVFGFLFLKLMKSWVKREDDL